VGWAVAARGVGPATERRNNPTIQAGMDVGSLSASLIGRGSYRTNFDMIFSIFNININNIDI